MKSKYELTISTKYVPDWTYVEAVRELLQNAIDNEAVDENNKYESIYKEDDETLSISNKSSKLTLDTLLLGVSTKRNDDRTIGQHGEGYKIAFMVLAREGKKVTVYNYGANEVWNVKLVKSKRYNGEEIVQVEVDKNPIWKKAPNNNLTIVIDSISNSDYENIQKDCLMLRDEYPESYKSEVGNILTDEDEVGNIFVRGLFVFKDPLLKYGYDIQVPVKLDRDRNNISNYDCRSLEAKMWLFAASENKEVADKLAKMSLDEVYDVDYIKYLAPFYSKYLNIPAESILSLLDDKDSFITDNSERYEYALKRGIKTTLVSSQAMEIVRHSNKYVAHELSDYNPSRDLLERLKAFRDTVESKLNDSELEELTDIVETFENEFYTE